MQVEDFCPRVARGASIAAEGLCSWTQAMLSYHAASKLVTPKLEKLVLADGRLREVRVCCATACLHAVCRCCHASLSAVRL